MNWFLGRPHEDFVAVGSESEEILREAWGYDIEMIPITDLEAFVPAGSVTRYVTDSIAGLRTVAFQSPKIEYTREIPEKVLTRLKTFRGVGGEPKAVLFDTGPTVNGFLKSVSRQSDSSDGALILQIVSADSIIHSVVLSGPSPNYLFRRTNQ